MAKRVKFWVILILSLLILTFVSAYIIMQVQEANWRAYYYDNLVSSYDEYFTGGSYYEE